MSPSRPVPSIEQLEAENARLRGRLLKAGLDPDAPGLPPPDFHAPDLDRLLRDSISEGLYVVDRDGLTTVCNTAMLRILGFPDAGEVIGRSLHEVIHHSHADGSHYPVEACPIYRAARDGVSMVVADELFFRHDGTPFPVEYRTVPLIREGRLEGAICTFVDITARLDADRQLKDSQERLALAAEAGGIGIFDYDVRAGTLRWDDRVSALLSLPPGRPATIEENLAAVHPDDRHRIRQSLGAAMDPAGDGDYQVQFRTLGAAGISESWIEARGRASFRDGVAVRLLGVVRDVSAPKAAERHLRLMVNELNHRVKNSLAMVQAVAAQTFRNVVDVDKARSTFTERLVALARAHDVLTAANWEGADLRHVVDLTARSHSGDEAGRFEVQGDNVMLTPKTALAFSLALHELATNAVKYGALSNASGRVSIRWTTVDGRTLSFTWRESGGPAVEAPHRRGFGSKLIERGLASELQGTVRIEFHADGVVCYIEAPLPSSAHGT